MSLNISDGRNSVTVKPRFTDTHLIQTAHYYGQFSLFLRKERPQICSRLNPLNKDTPLIVITDTFYGHFSVRINGSCLTVSRSKQRIVKG